jgi:hypothetical protein
VGDLATVVGYAKSKLGDPYSWGASGPDSFDCSGLLKAAYGAAGVPLPHQASAIGKMGTAVPLSAAQIGDVVYFDEPGATDHVGVLVDKVNGGHMIDAPTAGKPVRVDPITGYTSIRDLGLPGTSSGGVATSPADFTARPVDGVSVLDPSAWLGLLLKVGGGLLAGALVVVGMQQAVKR